jgi:arginine exporter protein ArgO
MVQMKNYLNTAVIALVVIVMFAICAVAFIIAPTQENPAILTAIGFAGMMLVGHYGSKAILSMYAADIADITTTEE